MQKNETYSVEITGLTAEGAGVARIDGQVVFVPGVIPGETCQIRIDHVGRTCAYASLLRVEKPSAHRVKPECEHFGQCGGCVFWHMDYDCELQQKKQRVQDALSRIGGVSFPELEITGSETIYAYRNKVQFPVQPQNGRAAAGFYRAGSHSVIPITTCRIQPESAGKIREAVLSWMAAENIPAYDEKTHTGLVRHIYLRCGKETGEILVCLIVNGERLPKAKQLVRTLLAAEPAITGILANYNTKKSNVILGDRFEPLYGEACLTDKLLGLTFRLSPAAFYQVNHDQAERLYEKAIEFAGLTGTQTALDLYCGSGTITLCLARHVKKVYGVEIVDAAIRDAKENAKQNNIKNAEFFCADAGKAAQRFAQEGIRPDVIVIDPPRKGVSEDVIDAMAQMSPSRIVYVSCDPATLARDIARLREKGYRAKKAHAFDLFPRCAHVETVVLLSHKKPDGHINVKVEFGEGDGKVPLDNIAKRAESYKPKERVTYKMIKEYIEAKYGFKVHTAYIAEVKRDLGLPMYDTPNAVEELKQPRKHPTVEKVEAIKDALRYFEIMEEI